MTAITAPQPDHRIALACACGLALAIALTHLVPDGTRPDAAPDAPGCIGCHHSDPEPQGPDAALVRSSRR